MGESSISKNIEVGGSFGKYEIESLLGKGGMGEVYLALDKALERKTALKLLSADATKDEERVRRFKQEARSVMKLNHPNIVTIYDFGEIDSIPFIATEYIQGETLRQRIDRGLPLHEALHMMIQVATALDFAHAHEIIHRDIKPENVMIRPDKIVKVVDFGLAKLPNPVEQIDGPDLARNMVVQTEPGTVMGTVHYMSPEQAQGYRVDKRSDIFSFGVVLYEVVTGRRPFVGPDIRAIITAILTTRPRPLLRFVEDVPPELQRIVSKALDKDVGERYQTVRDMLNDLKKLKSWMDFQTERVDHEPGLDLSPERVPIERILKPRAPGPDPTTVRVPPPTTSSAKYIIDGIKRHKRIAFFAMTAVVVLLAAAFPMLNRAKPITKIAVFPFRTTTDVSEAQQKWMTNQIITILSQAPSPQVIPYDDVSACKDDNYIACARELGVRAVVTGRLNKSGEIYSASAELVNVEDDTVLVKLAENRYWKSQDLPLAAREIAKGVLDKLQPKLNSSEKSKLEADDQYAQGRREWSQRTAEGLRAAIDHYDAAIRLDSKYAKAYAGKADCYNILAVYCYMNPIDALPLASKAAQDALKIDDNLAEAHTSLGLVKLLWDRNWDNSETEFKLAIVLDKNNALSHQWYSALKTATGRADEAIDQVNQAAVLDTSSLSIQAHVGFAYYFAGRFDETLLRMTNLVASAPDFFVGHRYLGWAYEQKGKYEEAVKEFQRASEIEKDSPMIKAELAHAYAVWGKQDQAQRLWRELESYSAIAYVSPYSKALVCAGLGQKAQAIQWLQRAAIDRCEFIVFVNVDPRFKSLRSEPGFVEVVRSLGFPAPVSN